ncbi:flagellar hook-basal body complex protein FliE [Paenibacillus sp. T1]|uniref:Flagellar hook-basal body complex protein FliE n=2 Tax=Paenibacillus glycinis TaxID=2697035 RepID=A0ABW9XIV6_9BACL|nr:flagellar hook-basal body complex protein FliE [Paenibacillus glycinis]
MTLNPVQIQTVKPVVSNNLGNSSSPADITKTFSDFLQNALDGVGAQEQNVHTMNDQYLLGNVDVSQVMVASEQAELGLQLTSQIRNKVIEAYQEIMRMQI